jgi:hypothetical protein
VYKENCQTIGEVWDNQNLKLTFRRNFSPRLMEQMYALEAIAQGITLTFDTESLVWAYNSSRVYSTSSLYAIHLEVDAPSYDTCLCLAGREQ